MRFICLLVLCLIGCGPAEPDITSGTVTRKEHHDSYTRLVPMTRIDFDGDAGTVWTTDHVPEKWILEFAFDNRRRSLSVSKEVYNSTKVGTLFEMEPIELPVTVEAGE